MPYKNKQELPDAVKALPSAAQDGWMKAYNAAHQQYNGDESKANATAWSAVAKMGYVKKGDTWIKAEYVKDTGLRPGTFDHPNNPGQKLTVTDVDLVDYVSNTQKFLDAGGSIPLTVSHPKSERDKIEQCEGDVLGVFIDQGSLHIACNPSEKAQGWIKEDKLKAVSPGIYHDVVTSIGKLSSLIDHVALTNSPFNVQQNGFMPVNASRYGQALHFFENSYISDDKGGDMRAFLRPVAEKLGLTALYNRIFGSNDTTPEGGDVMELEQAKQKIAELEAAKSQQDADLEKLRKSNEELTGKVTEFEKADQERTEQAKKSAMETFEARLNKLIEDKKVEPKNRDQLIENFNVLYGTDYKGDICDLLLGRFDAKQPAENEIKPEEMILTIEKEQYDLNTNEGREKLDKLFEVRAKELAKENGKSVHQNWEQAMIDVCEEHDINIKKL